MYFNLCFTKSGNTVVLYVFKNVIKLISGIEKSFCILRDWYNFFDQVRSKHKSSVAEVYCSPFKIRASQKASDLIFKTQKCCSGKGGTCIFMYISKNVVVVLICFFLLECWNHLMLSLVGCIANSVWSSNVSWAHKEAVSFLLCLRRFEVYDKHKLFHRIAHALSPDLVSLVCFQNALAVAYGHVWTNDLFKKRKDICVFYCFCDLNQRFSLV